MTLTPDTAKTLYKVLTYIFILGGIILISFQNILGTPISLFCAGIACVYLAKAVAMFITVLLIMKYGTLSTQPKKKKKRDN